jgi:hypothetical protein
MSFVSFSILNMLALVPQIVWLHEFRAFEDKPNVFNLTAQTIDVSLVKMLGTHCGLDETLVVGSRGYKDIIEKRMVCITV